VLTPWIAFGEAANPPPPVTWDQSGIPLLDSHWHDVRKPTTPALIRQIGEDSATLLKNTNGALPLKDPKIVAIIGSDAGPNSLSGLNAGGAGFYPPGDIVSAFFLILVISQLSRLQEGSLSIGGGSGWVIPPYLVTPYEALASRLRGMNSQIWTVFNDTAYDDVAATVGLADAALVFVSAFASEGSDRKNLLL
jgi:beta-glucosidase